jgi:acylphosphatase
MSAVFFRVSGRVQAVSFRAFTQWQARHREIVGWVRNRRDGSVEGLAAGREEDLQEFFTALREGPAVARVDALELRECEVQELADTEAASEFEIRPTQ